MGGGDLNLKKSWHPSTMKNQERVWKAEAAQAHEDAKMAEFERELKEERDREQLRNTAAAATGDKQLPKTTKLDWMYKGMSGHVSREEYLLGRKVDGSLQLLERAEKEVADQNQQPEQQEPPKSSHVIEYEILPESIARRRPEDDNVGGTVVQVDMRRKLLEDPLLAIRKREEMTKRELTNNPVKRKQLQLLIDAIRGTRSSSSSSSSFSSDSDSAQKRKKRKKEKKHKNKKKRAKSKKRKNKTSGKTKKSKKKAKKRRKESSSESSESESSASDARGRKSQQDVARGSIVEATGSANRPGAAGRHNGSRTRECDTSNNREGYINNGRDRFIGANSYRSGQANYRSRSRESRHFNRSGSKEARRSYRSRSREARRPITSTSGEKHPDRSRSWEARRRNRSRSREPRDPDRSRSQEARRRDRSKSREVRHPDRSRSREIRRRDRSRSHEARRTDRSRSREARRADRNRSRSQEMKRGKMSDKEMKRKREEMMRMAKARDEERKGNVKRYEEERKKEEEEEKFSEKFVRREVLSATAGSSVEERVKSRASARQRGGGLTEANFTRK